MKLNGTPPEMNQDEKADKPDATQDKMRRALSTALPPEVARRLQQGRAVETPQQVPPPAAEADEPEPEPEPARPARRARAAKPPEPARRTKPTRADLGELDLGERVRQITTRMPISLADRLDIAVLRQKRTGGDYRSIQAIMVEGALRMLDDIEAA